MSVSNWKEREREQRCNDILDVAETLFFSKGYDNVSMNSIAKEVGLGKSTLYIYFDNKEELFYAVVLRGVNILSFMIKEKVGKEDTGIEKLNAFKKAYEKFIKKYHEYFQAYNYLKSGRFDLNYMLSSDYSEILMKSMFYSVHIPSNFLNANETIKEIFKLREKIFFTLYKSIKLGIKEGTIRSDVDPLKITILQILICENMGNLPFDFRMIIEGQGLNYVNFTKELDDFVSQLYIK
ncbi:TetR/AcrR family transcriptional regulator [Methanobrevibacter sp. TMH8]|uniref:TetR/AcrR family transcriptional regulator n=1 Tax=Methanobrevibacter sp. TMH8 TaxID=2848611 RepID=UPI001CCFB106|nr:TetR/AcrR family transcriptional regulator [Methanobrevibacter sp. TMH8]MBZ9570835.1 TetR/AcrR family transcriptional regulator [Methanobrevibacter sp. TMH8]